MRFGALDWEQLWERQPGKRFTKNYDVLTVYFTQIQLSVFHILATEPQQNFVHTTTAMLTWHVQHFNVTESLVFELGSLPGMS